MQNNNFRQLDLFGECDPILKDAKKSTQWQLYTDGASRRNPGPSGAGIYIVQNSQAFFKKGFFLGTKTNNQAEYLALVLGVYYAKKQMHAHDALYIMSDSELLIRQMKGIYRVKNAELKSLSDLAKNMLLGVKHSFCHVLREYNTEADALANNGIDSKVMLEPEFILFLQSHDIRV